MQRASPLIGKTDVFLLAAGALGPFEDSVGRVITTMEDLGQPFLDLTDRNRCPQHGVLWLTELACFRKSNAPFSSVTSHE